jgi:predicted ATP-grasp superfamily ATP-dependent carboligase
MSRIKDALMDCIPSSEEYNAAMEAMVTWSASSTIKQVVFHELMELGHSPTMDDLMVYFAGCKKDFEVNV